MDHADMIGLGTLVIVVGFFAVALRFIWAIIRRLER